MVLTRDDQVVRDPATSMWVRVGTYDLEIAREVITRQEYRYLPIDATDRVLDLGGNIGCAAVYFARKGAKVYSVEPDPMNAALFRWNAPMACLMNAAVRPTGGMTTLYLCEGQNKAMHSVVAHRGYREITVPSVSFTEVMRWADPTAVKCDIEGGEFELPWEELPITVRALTMEIHAGRKAWRDSMMYDLTQRIEALKFEQIAGPKVEQPRRSGWPVTLTWRRDV